VVVATDGGFARARWKLGDRCSLMIYADTAN
jgi:hypothetical protein